MAPRDTRGTQVGSTTTSFGSWVRRRRLALDLTQAALARRAGCSLSAVKKIERDERRPSRVMAGSLADALGIPPDQRDRFTAAALGEAAPDRLVSPTIARDPGPAPAWLSRPAAAPERPVVGRDAELALLERHLSAALRGGGRAVFITGEAGQGKTALLTALARRAEKASPDLIVARGAGSAVSGFGDSGSVIRDLFRMFLADPLAPQQAELLTAGQAERLWRFAPAVARTVERAGGGLVESVISGTTVHERLGLGPAPRPDQPSSKENLFDEVTDVLRLLADEQPLLVLLDDMQWADSASAELLFRLTRRITTARILIVCAYRGSEVTGTERPAVAVIRKAHLETRRDIDHAHIDLDRSTPEVDRALCSALLELDAPGLDEAVHAEFYRRTRGHPLFVHELVRDLTARGDLVPQPDGSWAARADVDWHRAPARVAAVIEQRLERLPPAATTLLSAAAVEGEHFHAEVAASVSGTDERVALTLLADQLDRIHGVVREAGAVQAGTTTLTRYSFAHEMFRRFVYDRLSPGQRRDAHRLLAGALKRLHRDDLDALAPQLAYHYSRGGDAARAVPYLIQAGDRARLAFAYDDALAAYTKAVSLLQELGDEEELARTLTKIGLSHQTAFDHASAQQAFDAAFRLRSITPRRLPDPASPETVTLRLLSAEPDSLDPVSGGDSLAIPLSNALFSGLLRYDTDGNVVPDVAEHWAVSDDGRRYTFHLRDDVVWTDGSPVSAHDFAYTYGRALTRRPRPPLAADLLSVVAGAHDDPPDPQIDVPDDHTLVVQLAQPAAYFLSNVIHDVLMPVPRHVVERHGDTWWQPGTIESNGPFALAGWDRRRGMTLQRNPRHFRDTPGNVQWISIDFPAKGTAEYTTRYLDDDVDVLALTLGTPLAVIDRLRRLRLDDYTNRAALRTVFYSLDPTKPPMTDRRLRQAMAMAVNKDALASRSGAGGSSPARGGFLPPGMPGHLPDAALPTDPGAAARLLEESLDGAPPPELTLAVIAPYAEIAEQLASDWRAVGLPVDVRIVANFVDQRALIATGTGPVVAVAAWVADYPDPDSFLRVAVEAEVPTWRGGKYHALVGRAARIPDPEARLGAYHQAERVLADEAVVVPLLYLADHLLIKPWVVSYPTLPFVHSNFWSDVVIDAARQQRRTAGKGQG